MGEIIQDGNIEREVVKVACPVVEGNDQGFYVSYRDAMKEGEVEFTEGDLTAAADAMKEGEVEFTEGDLTAAADYSGMSKAMLKDELTAKGIEFDADATKADLLALLG